LIVDFSSLFLNRLLGNNDQQNVGVNKPQIKFFFEPLIYIAVSVLGNISCFETKRHLAILQSKFAL